MSLSQKALSVIWYHSTLGDSSSDSHV